MTSRSLACGLDRIVNIFLAFPTGFILNNITSLRSRAKPAKRKTVLYPIAIASGQVNDLLRKVFKMKSTRE
jgi:hypothetical protein